MYIFDKYILPRYTGIKTVGEKAKPTYRQRWREYEKKANGRKTNNFGYESLGEFWCLTCYVVVSNSCTHISRGKRQCHDACARLFELNMNREQYFVWVFFALFPRHRDKENSKATISGRFQCIEQISIILHPFTHIYTMKSLMLLIIIFHTPFNLWTWASLIN